VRTKIMIGVRTSKEPGGLLTWLCGGIAKGNVTDAVVLQGCQNLKPEGCAGGAGSWAVEGWGPPVRFIAIKLL